MCAKTPTTNLADSVVQRGCVNFAPEGMGRSHVHTEVGLSSSHREIISRANMMLGGHICKTNLTK